MQSGRHEVKERCLWGSKLCRSLLPAVGSAARSYPPSISGSVRWEMPPRVTVVDFCLSREVLRLACLIVGFPHTDNWQEFAERDSAKVWGSSLFTEDCLMNCVLQVGLRLSIHVSGLMTGERAQVLLQKFKGGVWGFVTPECIRLARDRELVDTSCENRCFGTLRALHLGEVDFHRQRLQVLHL